MKKTAATAWSALGTTGKLFLLLFLFYFITNRFKH